MVRGCAALKTPFSRSLSSSLRLPFSACFSSLRPPFQQKSHFFTNFAVLEPKFTKISVPKPQILQNFSSKASYWPKIQFFKPYLFSKTCSFSPYFSCLAVLSCSLSSHLRSKFRGGGHLYLKLDIIPVKKSRD